MSAAMLRVIVGSSHVDCLNHQAARPYNGPTANIWTETAAANVVGAFFVEKTPQFRFNRESPGILEALSRPKRTVSVFINMGGVLVPCVSVSCYTCIDIDGRECSAVMVTETGYKVSVSAKTASTSTGGKHAHMLMCGAVATEVNIE